MFRVLWSQLTMLLHYDLVCVGFMSPQKLLFVITYLLEDEQELTLGMLIRCKRIHNFWCSMLVLHQFLYVLSILRCTFYAFSGTNLLTRCHSASFCFLLFLVSEKFHRKYSQNWTKQIAKFLISRDEDGVRRGGKVGPQGGHTMLRRGQPWART